MMKIQRATAYINLKNIANNMKNIKKHTKALVMAIVKADGYGHGAYEVAQICVENGASYIGVATIDEAVFLRKKGIKIPILVLGDTLDARLEDVVKYDIMQTIFCVDVAKKLSDIAVCENKIANIHIKIDSGMGRIGFMENDKDISDIFKISTFLNINIDGIFSHFSDADAKDKKYTNIQYEKYMKMVKLLENGGIVNIKKHISNSASILDSEKYSLDIVRAGIILYGIYPSDNVLKSIEIKKAMELKSYIAFVKMVDKGAVIGYGRGYITPSPKKIATVPIGYADGYSRSLSNVSRVIVNGEYAKVCGSVCMDQLMIDVSHIKDVKRGDIVVLIGEDKGKNVPVEEIARLQNTIPYEIVCNIGKRVSRVYIK